MKKTIKLHIVHCPPNLYRHFIALMNGGGYDNFWHCYEFPTEVSADIFVFLCGLNN